MLAMQNEVFINVGVRYNRICIKVVIVDVFGTSKDIMIYIIIVCCCTPICYVFSSFQDVIIVYGPWGTTFIVSKGNSP